MAIKNLKIATLSALATIPLSGFLTDIYLPSMPQMTGELEVTSEQMQLTVTLFLICYAMTQVFAGSFLDSLGRYKLTLYSLLLLAISSLLIGFTSNIYVIYFLRALQGVGAGVAANAKRSLFVDIYTGEKRQHYLSILAIVWSAGPIIAPFIGGYLEHLLGWRSNFYALSIYAFVLLITESYFSGETIIHKHSLKIKSIFNNYLEMVKASDFFLSLLILSTCYGLIFIFSLSGAFIIEHTMGYSPVVAGNVSLILGPAWMAGGFLGKFFLKYELTKKVKSALFFLFIFVAGMILVSEFQQTIYLLTIFAFIIHLLAGFIFNVIFSYCLTRFPTKAALSGGFAAGGNTFVTSILSYSVVKLLQIDNQLLLSVGYSVMVLLCFTCFVFFNRRYREIKDAR